MFFNINLFGNGTFLSGEFCVVIVIGLYLEQKKLASLFGHYGTQRLTKMVHMAMAGGTLAMLLW